MSLRQSALRIPLFLALVASVLIAFSTRLNAVDFQPVSAEELKITSEPLSPGAPAIILFRQVDRDDRGNTAHEDNYFRIKILKEEGRKYADIEIPFRKEMGKVVNVHGRTIRPDGSIANFDGKVYEKTIAKTKGLKYLAKTFTLPDVQVGGIIEYFYTVDFDERYVFDSHWILSHELFTKAAKFSLKPYTSSYNTFNVRWSWQGLPEGGQSPKEGPDHIVRLEVSNIPAFQTEDYMPPENELKARVDFTYSEEAFEKDSEKFWKRHGKRMNDGVEDFVNKRKTMEQAVAQIVSPNDSAEVKLKKIYDRVQQLRNTSYEVRKTEQEQKRDKEKDINNVEDIWKRGYGNGYQLTWLYLALVRAAGFEAYPVMASGRREYFFQPNMMDVRKLDSNVVLVKVDGKEIYCDPGAAFTPFGMLDWTETGVPGLRLDKDGGTWVRTMLPVPSDSRIERTANLTMSENGDLEGKVTISFSGLQAKSRRVEERNEDEADRKKFLEDEAKEAIPVAVEVELTNKPDWTSSAAPLVAEYSVKIPGWVSGAGRRALFPVGLFSAAEKGVFDHANRVHPIYFQFPSEKLDDITINLPLGWQVSTLPKPHNDDAKVVVYTLAAENDKGILHLKRKLSINILLVDTKYYPALRNFFQVVRTGDEEQVVLQPIGAKSGGVN
ncbi:MAG TPA: DUF3857 domain-containing protein [Terriglobales bacterium]|nr:DUF3857 domain-containing protein [Terriglobales bacterium]